MNYLRELRASTPAGHLVVATPELYMTMIDGKVLNSITGTSSNCCAVCGAPPSLFNVLANLGTDVFEPIEGALNYGISPLHCWLNTFNHLLKLSYRLPIGQSRIQGEANKRICRQRKREIQTDLKSEFGIRVDFPNPNGTGNSNNGNCARRAFQNPVQFAQILGLDPELVTDIKVLLICISSRYKINADAYEAFAQDVLRRYIDLYGWFPLNPTLHKLIVHGSQVARNLPLPPAWFTEEGLEASHKTNKKTRRDHCRPFRRDMTMTDMLNRALDRSDPVIAMMALERSSKFQRFHLIPEAARNLLIFEDEGPEPEDAAENEDDVHNNMLDAALDGYFVNNEDDI